MSATATSSTLAVSIAAGFLASPLSLHDDNETVVNNGNGECVNLFAMSAMGAASGGSSAGLAPDQGQMGQSAPILMDVEVAANVVASPSGASGVPRVVQPVGTACQSMMEKTHRGFMKDDSTKYVRAYVMYMISDDVLSFLGDVYKKIPESMRISTLEEISVDPVVKDMLVKFKETWEPRVEHVLENCDYGTPLSVVAFSQMGMMLIDNLATVPAVEVTGDAPVFDLKNVITVLVKCMSIPVPKSIQMPKRKRESDAGAGVGPAKDAPAKAAPRRKTAMNVVGEPQIDRLPSWKEVFAVVLNRVFDENSDILEKESIQKIISNEVDKAAEDKAAEDEGDEMVDEKQADEINDAETSADEDGDDDEDGGEEEEDSSDDEM